MNNFFKIILLFITGISIVSCSKDKESVAPLRDYTAQYATDLASIETFMQTHYMTVVNSPGNTEDMDVTYTLITDPGTQTSIWNQTTYPIQTRLVTVTQDDVEVTYKLYYLKLREGSGATSKSPCNVDRVLTSYRGEYIFSSTENVAGVDVTTIKGFEFEELINPQTFFNLTAVIRGWSEIFPQFKTGTYTGNPDGTVSYDNFGAGVMFIPSGLAYYSNASGGIPAYSPLIFNFKLYEIQRVDQDGDGIFSYQEDLNNDGYVLSLAEGITNPDDTDGDGIPDFLDVDDDGDFFTTKSELKYINPLDPSNIDRYYPFDGVLIDDPATPYIDERKGAPRKFTGPNNTNGLPTSNDPADFTDPTRLRRYRDATAKPPYSDQ
jgi:hypothetical protein